MECVSEFNYNGQCVSDLVNMGSVSQSLIIIGSVSQSFDIMGIVSQSLVIMRSVSQSLDIMGIVCLRASILWEVCLRASVLWGMSQSFILWRMSLRDSLLRESVSEFQYDGECISELCIVGSVSVNSNQFRVPSVIICTEISFLKLANLFVIKPFKFIRYDARFCCSCSCSGRGHWTVQGQAFAYYKTVYWGDRNSN